MEEIQTLQKYHNHVNDICDLLKEIFQLQQDINCLKSGSSLEMELKTKQVQELLSKITFKLNEYDNVENN